MIQVDRFNEALSRSGLSQGALARIVGVTPAAIQQIANGKTRRSKYTNEIARALGVSEDWLMGRTEDEFPVFTELTQVVEALPLVTLRELLVEEKVDVFRYVDLRFFPFPIAGAGSKDYIFVSELSNDMAPHLMNDDLILIEWGPDEARIDRQDALWIINYHGFSMIRRVRIIGQDRLLLVADSTQVPDIEASAEEVVVMAPVVWLARNLR